MKSVLQRILLLGPAWMGSIVAWQQLQTGISAAMSSSDFQSVLSMGECPSDLDTDGTRDPEVLPRIQWTRKSDMPGPLYAFNAVSIGDKIFAIGGRGKEERHDRYTYVYDVTLDTWEVKREPIFPRSNHAVAALAGKIYVFGGNDSQEKAEAYEPETDNWKELAPIPTPRMHINYSAAAYDGRIYLMGGLEKESGKMVYDHDSDKNEMYDPVKNAWMEKSPMPSPRQTVAVVAFDHQIYAIGGKMNFDDQKDVFVYDPESDTWEPRAELPEARFISGAAVVKDRIVVITGVNGRQWMESKVFVYEPLKDRWHDLGEVPKGFMLAGVASAGEKFYVLGGSDLEYILFQCLEGVLDF